MNEHQQYRNGHGWRNAVIAAFGGLSMLFGGWMLNEAATERRAMNTTMNDDRQRIAVLEAQVRRITYDVEQLRRDAAAKR